MPTNAKAYLEKNFPGLLRYKRTASRKFEKRDDPTYRDDWWFKFSDRFLDEHEFIIFAGALDDENKNFKIFKVPSSYFRDNPRRYDTSGKGMVNVYVHLESFIDVRVEDGLSFGQFALN
jgi:hypothetical protein